MFVAMCALLNIALMVTHLDRTESEKKRKKIPIQAHHTLYGNTTRSLNLNSTCTSYQSNVPRHKRFITIGGLFNTGTNLLSYLLLKNCHANFLPSTLWGKHNPVEARHTFTRTLYAGSRIDDVHQTLTVVMIKDPLTWGLSMCKNPYEARFPAATSCPNLFADDVTVTYNVDSPWGAKTYKGLVGMRGTAITSAFLASFPLSWFGSKIWFSVRKKP